MFLYTNIIRRCKHEIFVARSTRLALNRQPDFSPPPLSNHLFDSYCKYILDAETRKALALYFRLKRMICDLRTTVRRIVLVRKTLDDRGNIENIFVKRFS